MAIVHVRSTNPAFSFLIKKNPNSGMMIRSIRKGMAYGWYSDESTFHVYFKDADNEISYKQHENETFEYLNVSRYNTPLFPLNAINEFFSAPLKEQRAQDVEGFEHSFFINMIHIELDRYIDFFSRHLKDFSFELTRLEYKSYALTVTTTKSLYELLHVVSVLCLFLSMFGNEYIDISDSILEKYIKSINVIDAPFYIRSLFVRNFLTSKERYKKYKKALEKTDRYAIQFDYGNTAVQRRYYISDKLPFNKPIVDVGCGEGFYAMPFAPKIQDNYYAIDINQEALDMLIRKTQSKEIGNIIPLSSVDHFLEEYGGEQVDVVMTEVIEHMSQEEAKALIVRICRYVAFEQFIITTPNADFNRFYEIDGYRHEDHKWEMGSEAFRTWMTDVIDEANVYGQFVEMGDGVDNIRTTQGVILKKRGA